MQPVDKQDGLNDKTQEPAPPEQGTQEQQEILSPNPCPTRKIKFRGEIAGSHLGRKHKMFMEHFVIQKEKCLGRMGTDGCQGENGVMNPINTVEHANN